MKLLLLLVIFVPPQQVLTSSDVGFDLRKMENCPRRRFTTLVHPKGVVLQRSTGIHFSKDNQQFELDNTLDSLPSETQLLSALEFYYQRQLESELSEFDTPQKMKWLKYLPTLGITYTLDGKPRPAISWSSNFCLLYTSPSPRDATLSRMPSSA